MAATTAGAVKALLEAAGLGVPVFRDGPPPNQALPYITITEAVSISDDAVFNQFDDPEGHVVEQIQVDVWQQHRDPTTSASTESYTLPENVYRAMRGVRLAAAPFKVHGMRTTGMVRLLEKENNVVHHAILAEVRRVSERS